MWLARAGQGRTQGQSALSVKATASPCSAPERGLSPPLGEPGQPGHQDRLAWAQEGAGGDPQTPSLYRLHACSEVSTWAPGKEARRCP